MVNKVLQNISKLQFRPVQYINTFIMTANKSIVPREIGAVQMSAHKNRQVQRKIFTENYITDEFVHTQKSENVQGRSQNLPKKKKDKKVNQHINKSALAEYFDNFTQREQKRYDRALRRKQRAKFNRETTKELNAKSKKMELERNGWTKETIESYYGRFEPHDIVQEYEQEAEKIRSQQTRQNVKSKFIYKAMEKMFDDALPKKVKKRDGVETFDEYVYNSIKDKFMPQTSLKIKMSWDIPNYEKYSRDFGYNEFIDLKVEEVINNKVEEELTRLLPKNFKEKNKVNSIEEYVIKCARQERHPIYAFDKLEESSSRTEFQKYCKESNDYHNYKNFLYNRLINGEVK